MTSPLTSREVIELVRQQCIPKIAVHGDLTARPYVVGFTGTRPAVGKTTLSAGVARQLGDAAVHIDLDNWIEVNRVERVKRGVSGIDRSVWDLKGLHDALWKLTILGQEISVPIYDHQSGTSGSASGRVQPTRIVCIAGGSCLWPEVLPFINFVLAVQPASDAAERAMVLRRNLGERGYNTEEAEHDFDITREAYARDVAPAVVFADLRMTVNDRYEYIVAP